MKEVRQIAAEYAVAQTNEVMSLAIAKAYADGYQDGYKDCEKEIPAEFQKDKTEFVDLGLPSGTMWAADYEKKNGKWMYLPYEEASSLNIPTEEQWNELLKYCRWEYKFNSIDRHKCFVCVGPNGKCIRFFCNGRIQDGESPVSCDHVWFWANDKSDELDKKCFKMYYWQGKQMSSDKTYKGYSLPIRLVRIQAL